MSNAAETTILIDERQTGVRRLAGTDWPVVDQLHRVKKRSGRVIWRITRDLCNGTPSGAKDYDTKKWALAQWEIDGEAHDRAPRESSLSFGVDSPEVKRLAAELRAHMARERLERDMAEIAPRLDLLADMRLD